MRSLKLCSEKNEKLAYAERYIEADKRKNELYPFCQKMPESFNVGYSFIPKEKYTQIPVEPLIFQSQSRPFTAKLFQSQGSGGSMVRLLSHLMDKEESGLLN